MKSINITKFYNETTEEEKNNLYKSFNNRNLTNNLFFDYSMSKEDIKKYCIISEIKYKMKKCIQNSCDHQYYKPERSQFGTLTMKCVKCEYTYLI